MCLVYEPIAGNPRITQKAKNILFNTLSLCLSVSLRFLVIALIRSLILVIFMLKYTKPMNTIIVLFIYESTNSCLLNLLGIVCMSIRVETIVDMSMAQIVMSFNIIVIKEYINFVNLFLVGNIEARISIKWF